jgi:mannosyl-3-phosphoglycerate phosphatase family protein
MNRELLIFTDLDGSLLDHHTYSHAAADPLLDKLKQNRIPVMLTSSKTRTEMMQLCIELDNQDPFIAENGAAVFIPSGYFKQQPDDTQVIDNYWVKQFCAPRAHWQRIIQEHAIDSDPYITFAQAGIDGIVEMTGLDVATATAASQREYGEPLQWQGTPAQQEDFVQRMQQAGAHVLTGGRFLHVSGDIDKGKALRWLLDQYQQQQSDSDFISLAIGDSQNDVAMLEAADYALLIRSPVNDLPKLSKKEKVIISDATGPEGWVEGVSQILENVIETNL